MQNGILDFSPRGWGRVIAWTTVGTLFCIAVAIYADSFNFAQMTEELVIRSLLMDIFVPIFLAVPILLFLTTKLRDLAIAHHELAKYASTDALTGVLNRGAFTTLVEAYLERLSSSYVQPTGAVLLVDADNFKSINDELGHDRGDEALQIMAQSIKGALRGTDLVGRIGGEEFAVFLPVSGEDQAQAAAERVRRSVAEAEFAPDGVRRPLSVSVGGTVFESHLPLKELLRAADQRLYEAKRAGRNRVSIGATAGTDAAIPHAA